MPSLGCGKVRWQLLVRMAMLAACGWGIVTRPTLDGRLIAALSLD